jgi:hypothetical protein
MRIPLLFAAVLAVASFSPGDAAGETVALTAQVHYVGLHPIAKDAGDGVCYIEGPHVHVYAADKLQYREHEGRNYFIGDPVAYGYEGPRFAYKGHHPIHVHAIVGGPDDVEYCYLDGAHFHYFQPPPGPEFKLAGEAYFYVGPVPKVYLDARPRYVEINAVYRPFTYVRPTIEVEAPVGWIGAVAVVGPGGAAVIAPAPGVRAGVSVGIGVRVPPPPSISVGIGVNVGVGVGVRGGAIVKPGKHKGHKHKHKH